MKIKRLKIEKESLGGIIAIQMIVNKINEIIKAVNKLEKELKQFEDVAIMFNIHREDIDVLSNKVNKIDARCKDYEKEQPDKDLRVKLYKKRLRKYLIKDGYMEEYIEGIVDEIFKD